MSPTSFFSSSDEIPTHGNTCVKSNAKAINTAKQYLGRRELKKGFRIFPKRSCEKTDLTVHEIALNGTQKIGMGTQRALQMGTPENKKDLTLL